MLKKQIADEILRQFKAYAFNAQEWDIEKEDDYDDLVDSVYEIVYKQMERP